MVAGANTLEVGFVVEGTDQATPTMDRVNDAMEKTVNTGKRLNDANDKVASSADKATRGIRKQGQETSKTNREMQGFMKTLQGVAASVIAYALSKKTLELIAHGEAVRDVNVQYEAYMGNLDRNNDAIERLRVSTRGAVSDMALMEGAATALSVGVAKTEDEVVALAEIGSRLGGGQAGFLSLVNTLKQGVSSMETLDNVGISATRVRERMKELQSQMRDLSNDDAFRMAVVDVGREKLEKYGDALDQQVSALDRVQVQLDNIRDRFSTMALQAAAPLVQTVDQLMQLADMGLLDEALTEILTGRSVSDQQIEDGIRRKFNVVQTTIIEQARQMESFYQLMSAQEGAVGQVMTPDIIRDFMRESVVLAETDPEWSNDLEAMLNRVEERIGLHFANPDTREIVKQNIYNVVRLYQDGEEQLDAMLNTMGQVQTVVGQFGEAYTMFQQQARTYAVDLARAEQQRLYIFQQSIDSTNGMLRAYRNFDDAVLDANAYLGEMVSLQFAAHTEAGRLADGTMLVGDQDLANLEAAFARVEAVRDLFKQAHEEGLVTDDQLSTMQTAYDQAKSIADEFRSANDAIQKMKDNLDVLLGRQDAGAAGQITDDIIQGLKDAGYDPEQIAEMERQIQLVTGEETQAGVAYVEQVLPTLMQTAIEQGGQAAGDAILRYVAGVAMARTGGLTDAQIAGMGSAWSGWVQGGPGQAFSIAPGETPGEAAARLGVGVDQVLQATGASSPYNVQPGDYNLGGGVIPVQEYDDVSSASWDIALNTENTQASMDLLNQHLQDTRTDFDRIQSASEFIQDAWRQMTSTVQQITLRLNVDDPFGVMRLLEGTPGGAGIATVVRANGGTLPGGDPRTSPTQSRMTQ